MMGLRPTHRLRRSRLGRGFERTQLMKGVLDSVGERSRAVVDGGPKFRVVQAPAISKRLFWEQTVVLYVGL